jgi:hypothetical protein
MPSKPCLFRIKDVERLVRAAERMHLEVDRVEVSPTGALTLVPKPHKAGDVAAS